MNVIGREMKDEGGGRGGGKAVKGWETMFTVSKLLVMINQNGLYQAGLLNDSSSSCSTCNLAILFKIVSCINHKCKICGPRGTSQALVIIGLLICVASSDLLAQGWLLLLTTWGLLMVGIGLDVGLSLASFEPAIQQHRHRCAHKKRQHRYIQQKQNTILL